MAPSIKKTWRDSLPIDMLLSAVSVLVVAQSSSEIPEGLMNNPVLIINLPNVVGWDSSVGIATPYGLDRPGIKSRQGRDFPHPSRPALKPTQPTVQ